MFEIEIEEGKKAKLGVNKNDNPYMLASNFIDDHDLNPDYLETIVGWLDEQMEKVGPEGWWQKGRRPLPVPCPPCPCRTCPLPLPRLFLSLCVRAHRYCDQPARRIWICAAY